MLKGASSWRSNPEQCIAEAAGAVAVMALERIPADIRAGWCHGRVILRWLRNPDDAVSIPVMAMCVLAICRSTDFAGDWDWLYRREWGLTPADDLIHVDKTKFDALSSVELRTLVRLFAAFQKGIYDSYQGWTWYWWYCSCCHHLRLMNQEIRRIQNLRDELYINSKTCRCQLIWFVMSTNMASCRLSILWQVVRHQRMLRLWCKLGAEGVLVGSGISKSEILKTCAEAIVSSD